MDDFDRTLVRVSFLVSLLCIGIVTAWLVLASRADAHSCELFQGARIYGDPSISWFPPGTTCTYDNGAFVDTPTYMRLVVVAGAVFGLPFTFWMSRSIREE